jgi:hypothetical protein
VGIVFPRPKSSHDGVANVQKTYADGVCKGNRPRIKKPPEFVTAKIFKTRDRYAGGKPQLSSAGCLKLKTAVQTDRE